MTIAKGRGHSALSAIYEVPDDELAVGSTLGGPKVAMVIRANGEIERVFAIDQGLVLFGALTLRYYDAITGTYLSQAGPGSFTIHPERQEHKYSLSNGISIHTATFVLSGPAEEDGSLDPPGVYQRVRLRNDGTETLEIMSYAFSVLRGETDNDVQAAYDRRRGAVVAWNKSARQQCRVFGCQPPAEGYEATLDFAKAVLEHCPGPLSDQVDGAGDLLAVLQHRFRLEPNQSTGLCYLLSFGRGRREALKNYDACPDSKEALERTKARYDDLLKRAVVLTPDPWVNQGVVWAKANMLRVQTNAPTGWCFTNDPTRSNHSVARDTAWFGYGGDYLDQAFVRDSLLAYVERQEKSGMIVEYYDIRTGKTEDYGLNINDNTPLLILALFHHYSLTADLDFLKRVYPTARKAARYLLSQRNEQGLVWCNAHGTSDWGIVGWRNVIPNYRLSGATTEVNSECYAALLTMSHMARDLEKHKDSSFFKAEAEALRDAINTHLYNQENGLYYLNIDLEGRPHSDITSDLVFPVMFGVAGDRTASAIIARLSSQDFWTDAGIRTAPRDAPTYTPTGGWGLLGGVWVGVSFWYAFAAARYSPEFMAHALSTSFRNYASDPKRNNTVPGQFSEWLHGETLVNQGMMLSPWFPPRYLWAAIEGIAGFDASQKEICLSPRLAPDWKWLAVQRLPVRGRDLTWLVVRVEGDIRIYANFVSPTSMATHAGFDEDISSAVHTTGDDTCTIGLRRGQNLVLFLGNTAQRTVWTSVRLQNDLAGSYRVRSYSSMLGEWVEGNDLLSAADLQRGRSVELERKGFTLLEITQEV